MRKYTAAEMNRIAVRDKLPVKTEHESFLKRGVDREPTQHRGNTATELLRKSKPSRIEDMNLHRQRKNAERAMNYVHSIPQPAYLCGSCGFTVPRNAVK